MQTRAKRIIPILLWLLAAPAFAVPGFWSLLGPDGGAVTLLAVAPSDPRVVYAGVPQQHGIFRSLDGGVTWSWPGDGLRGEIGFPPSVLAVDSRRPMVVYAGGPLGLLKSTDGGASWLPVQQGLDSTPGIRALAVNPLHPNILFAGGSSDGIFKSNDGGAHWSRRTAGLPSSAPVSAFAIDPRSPNVVYAAIINRGVYKSTDAGQTWRATAFLSADGAIALTIAADRSGAALYAATYSSLYRSADGGATWALVQKTGGAALFTSVVAVPGNPRVLFGGTTTKGVFRSRDGGVSWAPVNDGLIVPYILTLATNSQGSVVYAGTLTGPAGVFQTADAGRSWRRTSRGLAAHTVTAVALEAGDPPVLWAGTPDDGVYRGLNGGTVWRRARIPGLLGPVTSIVADPDRPGTVYVLAIAASSVHLYRTADSGQSWTRLADASPFQKLARDPRTGALLLLGPGIARSVDGGLTWTPAAGIEAGDFIQAAAFDPASPQVSYAGGYTQPGSIPELFEARLYKSADGGLTWTRSDAGLTGAGAVQALAATSRGIYAGVDNSLFRSTDAGAHWSQASTAPPWAVSDLISDLAAAPDGTLYIGTRLFGGVFAVVDGGDWTPLDQGLASHSVIDLLLDPADPRHLYAGTDGGGLEALLLEE